MRRNANGQFNKNATGTIKERFESQFVRIPIGGCWLWTGPDKNKFWHGAFKLGARETKVTFAHRTAWNLYVGEIPNGMCVCHSCDNPSCVNPDHLFLGSQGDNVMDKVSKGMHLFGSKCPNSKITEPIAAQIKILKKPTKVMAEMFGISRQSVADIVYGRTWKHV